MSQELFDKVDSALDSIRPFLQDDGGNVKLVSVENNIATVELVGACSTCSMSGMTMKAGIEEAIKNAIPEIEQVVEIKSDLAHSC